MTGAIWSGGRPGKGGPEAARFPGLHWAFREEPGELLAEIGFGVLLTPKGEDGVQPYYYNFNPL